MYIVDGSLLEMIIQGNYLFMPTLDLKILSEGNTGNQKELYRVYLSSYVGNYAWACYLMKILDERLHWKWFKGIVSLSALDLKIPLEGNAGNWYQNNFKLLVFVRNINLEGIVSVWQPWPWKFYQREIQPIKRFKMHLFSLYMSGFAWNYSLMNIVLLIYN